MQKNKNNQWLFVTIGFILLAIIFVLIYIGYLMLSAPEDELDILSSSDGVTVIEPAKAIDNFSMTKQDGETIALSDLGDKYALISFGFTHCPDVCPTTLGDMRSIHERLDALADDIHFVFISVDGERDTPEVLSEYFQTLQVDSFMIGMTGTETEARHAGVGFGIDFILHEPDEFGNYQVDHTAGMFLVDKDSRWLRRYTFGTAISRIVEDLQELIQ